MAPLCREFGISRVTGYKIYERYKTCGLDGALLHSTARIKMVPSIDEDQAIG